MYNIKNFKNQIDISKSEIECPIIGCRTKVPRRKKEDIIPNDKFLCKNCNIYIYPSTFEYKKFEDNLLWNDEDDLTLLQNIFKFKRESRIERDNSEDALTWNIFRYLEKENLLSSFLKSISGKNEELKEFIYWSYSDFDKRTWQHLEKSRNEFGENKNRGSEPDLIIETDKTIYFIEAKFNASNNLKPSNINDKKNYLTGGNNWFETAFKSNYQTIAIDERKYELMRFWLQGTWIANNEKKEFYLINLVLPTKELEIEKKFGEHIKCNETNKFVRKTWRDIYDFIKQNELNYERKQLILKYFENKIGGFYNGKLKKGILIKNEK